jgi:peptidyl-tRNA hydrolase
VSAVVVHGMSKMYIAVLDEFPDFMTPTLVAHAVLRHHDHCYEIIEEYDEWFNNSFKKVVVRVNQKEFDKIAELPYSVLSWEVHTLGGKTSCVTVVVGEDIPKVLRFAKLWKPIGV